MVVHKKTGEIEHRIFKDILDYFGNGDVFVFNNTRVFPARLYGNKEKTGARIEVEAWDVYHNGKYLYTEYNIRGT